MLVVTMTGALLFTGAHNICWEVFLSRLKGQRTGGVTTEQIVKPLEANGAYDFRLQIDVNGSDFRLITTMPM